MYLRLSREDAGFSTESESIGNQRKFLMEYVERQKMEVYRTYIDDGFTGTNFDRPGFQQMISDIEAGKVDTVIVKDLSRLGRDHIDTGYYYERYFPLHGVRFIAVNDQIDTGREDGGNDTALFRAVFNDMYAKDISKKVYASFQAKRHNGEFIGSTAPYGYRRSEESKNRLEIDSETAPNVALIYQLFLEGENFSSIARVLTARGIPTPSQNKLHGYAASQWNEATVRRILTSPTYAGDLTQNRSRKVNYKVKKMRTLPPSQWTVVADTHQGIVSRQDFDRVQQRLRETRKRKENQGLFSVFCAECGRKMSLVKRNGREYYLCSSYRKYGKASGCTSHCCRKEELEEALLGALAGAGAVQEQVATVTLSSEWVVDISLNEL